AARAVDNQAECAALLAAAQELSRKDFAGKTVTLLWDVQEETGLFGASRMAARLEADIVFPVDTFVSSAGPLDGKRFAHLRLGEGPVLRAVDSSSITPRFWLEKVRAVAAAHGIPLQMGNTRGGNDGSVFVPRGAVNIPLSWPSTYSHSFIEKIHREDLENLVRLIVALVRDW
ncbi:MAG: M20/M25/M40 family metallo-hydrolase, partial [Candidatus Aminicenantales bacterium]